MSSPSDTPSVDVVAPINVTPDMTLLSGAQATIVETDGDKTLIRTPEPSPPGSTVRARISGVSCEFQLKVRNCKKEGDTFLIDGRVKNATREMKQFLGQVAASKGVAS